MVAMHPTNPNRFGMLGVLGRIQWWLFVVLVVAVVVVVLVRVVVGIPTMPNTHTPGKGTFRFRLEIPNTTLSR